MEQTRKVRVANAMQSRPFSCIVKITGMLTSPSWGEKLLPVMEATTVAVYDTPGTRPGTYKSEILDEVWIMGLNGGFGSSFTVYMLKIGMPFCTGAFHVSLTDVDITSLTTRSRGIPGRTTHCM